jgi:hypothetical protein
MTVHERATEICRRLATDVASIAPPGLGSWDRTWDIVADADTDFMIALTAWEADPTSEETKQQLRAAYARALDAWREAVAEWQREAAGR